VLDELDADAAGRFDVRRAVAELVRHRRRLRGELHALRLQRRRFLIHIARAEAEMID